MLTIDSIKDTLSILPEKPGVYQFINNNKIIYIGKAKNIKKRVSSYFMQSTSHNYKHEVLVRKITKINYIVVESESDALLLENNLIKENQPRYNVLLKDDKTYPWLCIKNETFPRIFYTRNYETDGSSYFGPYTSVVMVKTLLTLIKQLYNLRTCNLNLTKENILKGKFKRCLEYHLGNCKGPCENLQSEEDYNQSIQQIREIIKGNLQNVLNHLNNLMKEYSKKYLFEEANLVKQKIQILENFKSKSTIVNSNINDIDVFSYIDNEHSAYINFMKVVNGAIVQSHNIELVKKLDETKEELLGLAIIDIRKRLFSNSKEIIIPFLPDISLENSRFVIPVRGDKKKLLELSERNVNAFKLHKIQTKEKISTQYKEYSVLSKLQYDLKLNKLPMYIECFDNSNIQGINPVASCVVFKSGRPYKHDYRHFNIKSVKGANDFASMEEIIYRRYSRLQEEGRNFPDLIIIDGGKGQLNAALISLNKLNFRGKIPIIAIAKKLEEIYKPDDPVPLYLDKNSLSLKLIQRIRDEAHRFGISFHRQKRSGDMLASNLDQIKGIGDKTKEKLLSQVKNINDISNLKKEELIKIVGKRTSEILINHFNIKE